MRRISILAATLVVMTAMPAAAAYFSDVRATARACQAQPLKCGTFVSEFTSTLELTSRRAKISLALLANSLFRNARRSGGDGWPGVYEGLQVVADSVGTYSEGRAQHILSRTEELDNKYRPEDEEPGDEGEGEDEDEDEDEPDDASGE